MPIRLINPDTLSKPTGYSHVAVIDSGRQVHLSGQVALDSAGQLVGAGDLAAQAEQVYANVVAGLEAAGTSLAKVFKVVTYVVAVDPAKAATVRVVRNKYFGEGPFPASTMVGVTSLVLPDFLIEIEVIATLD